MSLIERLKGRRVGVVLSAGYFGFYGHAGFVDGLLEHGIVPSAWAGTSAGGMIAAFAAAGIAPARMAELLLQQRREQEDRRPVLPDAGVEFRHARLHIQPPSKHRQARITPVRLSLCNEVIRDLPFERQCALAMRSRGIMPESGMTSLR